MRTPENLFLGGAPRREGAAAASLLLAVLAISVVLFVTLRPVSGGYEAVDSTFCLWCDARASADAIANVLLFVPFGIALALIGLSSRAIIASGFIFSFLIETFQYASVAGRDSSPRDLIFNTAGAMTGLVLFRFVRWAIGLSSSGSARLSFVIATAVIATMLLSARLSAPVSMVGDELSVDWTEGQFSGETYQGRVLSVTVGDRAVPPGTVDDPAMLLSALEEGQSLVIRLEAGPQSPAYSEIFGLVDGAGGLLSVGLRDGALVLQKRTRGQALRLARPATVWDDALGSRIAGEPFEIEVRQTGSGYCAEIPPRSACDLGLTVGDGWMTILYSSYLPRSIRSALGYGWIFAMLAPLGFTLRARRASMIALALVVAAALAAPLLGLIATPPSEWLAGALAITAGALFRAMLQRNARAAASWTPNVDRDRRRLPRSAGPSQVWTRPPKPRRLR